MNDERLGKEIGEFYRETDVAPPDSKESARQVSSRLTQTPQLKRRRWLPGWLQRSTTPPTSENPDDPTPEVTGRTRSMFSPITAVTAGALVLAASGLLLVAQPFGQQEVTPGAESDSVVFSSFYGSVVDGDETTIILEMSDPRASGAFTTVDTRNEFRDELNVSSVVWRPMSARLVNENGSWTGTGTIVDTSWGGTGAEWILAGDGDYAGLTLVLGEEGYQGDEFWGAILSTDAIPPFPELPDE